MIKKRVESGVSDDMKAKLRRELQSQGADFNTAFNPFPIIFGVVALLVVIGGAGIFY